MDTRLTLEEVGINEPLNEVGATFSDFEPAALGGRRQHLNSVAGQSCGCDFLFLAEVPVLAHGANVRIIGAPIQQSGTSASAGTVRYRHVKPNHSWIGGISRRLKRSCPMARVVQAWRAPRGLGEASITVCATKRTCALSSLTSASDQSGHQPRSFNVDSLALSPAIRNSTR